MNSDHEDHTDIPVTPNILDPDLLPPEDNIDAHPVVRAKPKPGKRPAAADDAKPAPKSLMKSISDNKITIIVVFVIVIVLIVVAYFAIKFWSKEPEEGAGPPKSTSPQPAAAGAGEPAACPVAHTAKPATPAAPTAKPAAPVAKPTAPVRAAPVTPPQRPTNNVTHEDLVKNVSPEYIQKMLMKARGATSEKEDAKLAATSERGSVITDRVRAPSVEEVTDDKPADSADDDLGKETEDSTGEDEAVENNEPAAEKTPEKPPTGPSDANGALWVLDGKGPKPPANPVQREGLCTALTREGSYCKNPATHGDRCGTHKKR